MLKMEAQKIKDEEARKVTSNTSPAAAEWTRSELEIERKMTDLAVNAGETRDSS